jgi:Rod binding domain-containing protein
MGLGVSDLGFNEWASQVQLERAERGLPPTAVTHEQLTQVARAFEQILMGMMVDSMRDTIPQGGLLPEEAGHGIYEQMLDHEYVTAASEGRLSLGLTAAFERQFAALIADDAGQTSSQPPESLSDNNLHERRPAGS